MDNKNLSSEALLSNNGDMTFLDIVLPIHNFTYIQAYRAKSVKLRQPNWYLLIHPSHNIHHFIVYHLNFIEIPTNCCTRRRYNHSKDYSRVDLGLLDIPF